MSASRQPLRIGFIPLTDAAALIVAADLGFAAQEGLDIELVREVSWSNVRDKLNIGLFDAAHLLAPVAIASNLGLGHVRAPIVAPFALAVNGNAITVSPALHKELEACADGDLLDPLVSARALAAVVRLRVARGLEQLAFGMTFPFSTHNYQLRFWMAAGGVDPDEDLRLVVLPPPYMVDSLARGQVDGFCVGAPWNTVAVAAGVGIILHFGCEIFARAPEKVLALHESALQSDPQRVAALIRAHARAAAFIAAPGNLEEVARLLARPERVGVDVETIRRTLNGRLVVDAQGAERASPNYLLIDGVGRPSPIHAEWLYAQMLRWGQARFSPQLATAAESVFRADLYDAALGIGSAAPLSEDAIGACCGPVFDGGDIAAYLSAFAIGCKI